MTLKEWFYFFMAHYFKCFYQFCQWVSIVLHTSRWTALLTRQVKIIPYLLTPLLLSFMRKGPNMSRLQYVMEELLLFFPWVDRPFCAVSVSHLSYHMSHICITQNLAFLRKFRVNSLLCATFLWHQVTTISVIWCFFGSNMRCSKFNLSPDDDGRTDQLLCHAFALTWYDYFLLKLEKHLVVLPHLAFFIFPCISASKLQFHWSRIDLLVQSVFRPFYSDAFLGQWWRRRCICATIIILATVATLESRIIVPSPLPHDC